MELLDNGWILIQRIDWKDSALIPDSNLDGATPFPVEEDEPEVEVEPEKQLSLFSDEELKN